MAVSSSYARLFCRQAESYAAFRPTYPKKLFDIVCSLPGRDSSAQKFQGVALDVAAGSGQAAKHLTEYFTTVLAQDASPQQVEQLNLALGDQVTATVGCAEDTGFDDETFDLICCAQALHWLNLERFYSEAFRILKPQGRLAYWGYGTNMLQHKGAQSLFLDLYSQQLGPYWDIRRQHIDNKYAGMEPLNFPKISQYELEIQKEVRLCDFIGYLSTWSAYNTYAEQYGQSEAAKLLDTFQKQ